MRMKIMNVVGARPNFMKIAPIMSEIEKYPDEIAQLLVHTGQHYDREMSKAFFDDLSIPEPDVYLGVGSGSHAEQTSRIMVEFEKILHSQEPDVIILVGDVNSTLACSLVAAKIESSKKPLIAHVEAGLRSYDRTMPEEINRLVTDSISDILFTTSKDANDNLIKEGIPSEKIFFVGNVMIDTLIKHREKANETLILEKLGLGIRRDKEWEHLREYALLTLHRPSNVDDLRVFSEILEALAEIAKHIPIIFPIHPRTRKQIESYGLERYFNFTSESSPSIPDKSGVYCISPLGYLEFLQMMANSKLVLTDSGGLQEETTVLGIPCITIRENTERPVTILEGTNTLVGTDKEKIILEAKRALYDYNKGGRIPELWDGKAAHRIVKILREIHRKIPRMSVE